MLTPLEVFSGIRATQLLVRPMPIIAFRDKDALSQEKAMALIDVNRLHRVLDGVHKKVTERNEAKRTHSWLLHNSRTNVQSINFIVGDYVMVRSTKKRLHKLNIEWQ